MKLSKFVEIFKDDNDWNEKAIIGFLAFAAMVVTMLADLTTGYFGKDLVINEFIYNSFLILVLGCFGISGAEKIFKKPNLKPMSKHDDI